MSAASSTSGFNAEEPAAVIDPVRSAVFSAAVAASLLLHLQVPLLFLFS